MEKIKRIELIQARKKKSMTQSEVAKELNITQSVYARIESGCHGLKLEQAKKLSKLLKINISIL